MTSAVLRSAQAGAILTALGLSAGLMTGVAQADPPRATRVPQPHFPRFQSEHALRRQRTDHRPPAQHHPSLTWLPRGVRRGTVGPGRPALDHGGRRADPMA